MQDMALIFVKDVQATLIVVVTHAVPFHLHASNLLLMHCLND